MYGVYEVINDKFDRTVMCAHVCVCVVCVYVCACVRVCVCFRCIPQR